jgi:magnesium transporter
LRREAWDHLDKLIEKTRDEELAMVMASMTEEMQRTIFQRLPSDARKAHVVTQMEPPFGKWVLDPLPPPKAAAILAEMAADDMADIIADLSVELREAVLAILEAEEAEEVETLMQYGEETAGGIMVPDFIALRADNTAQEALELLRNSADVEMVYYIYVVDEPGHLVGVLSLRKLVTAGPSTRVAEIMESDVIRVTVDTDQEEVALLVSRYAFLAIPVVDDSNALLGVVTVDDIIDVIRDEATEDILKMAGAGTGLTETKGVAPNVRVRFPWLLASCAGGLIAAAGMAVFEHWLQSQVFFTFFLPLVLGVSGNVGTQAATVTVRALAVGHIAHADKSWAVVRRETMIGIVLGITYGLLIGGVAAIFASDPMHAFAIGLSVSVGMIMSNIIGTSIPIVLNRLSIDPAVATGPILTTSVDIVGVFTYFGIVGLFAGWF